jgi:Arc/MetJ-type ribon-helix-helix transcriptional regulator
MPNRDSSETKFYSVPVSLSFDARVRARMEAAGFNSVAEYVRYTIREDLEREEERQLEASLLESIRRGDHQDADPEYFEKLRSRARARAKRRK